MHHQVISDCVDPPSSPSESELDRRMEVTVLTDRTTPETTADGAAGIWGPYLITDTPVDDQRRWAQERELQDLELRITCH